MINIQNKSNNMTKKYTLKKGSKSMIGGAKIIGLPTAPKSESLMDVDSAFKLTDLYLHLLVVYMVQASIQIQR